MFMKTKLSTPAPAPTLARPKPTRLLPTQSSPDRVPDSNLDPHLLSLHATAVTTLLADILAQRGGSRWGINE